ncbi:MAG: FecR domain-containing protein [Opitutaceae bacterium]|nr:FecR domain-containing protein [Opitutaceae bacterium]
MNSSDDGIDEVASEWLTRRAEGLSPAQEREFEQWCREDPRHSAAVARLQAACALLEKMPQIRAELQPVVEFPVRPRAIAPPKRFPVLRLLTGLAAAVALASFGWWQWLRPAPTAQIHATSSGGYERVVLADRSVIELNADSAVRLDFAPRERRVTLLRGEAHFTVAPDATRPFVVSAAGVAVRAVGTAFNVRLASAAVEVLVTEGKVVVSEPGAARPADPVPTLLAANERTRIALAPPPKSPAAGPAAAPVVEAIAPEAIREALSWQERKLAFAETPLREVIAQFNRRNRLQLVLGDDALGARPVGGTFAADNVEGFIRLLESSGSITIDRRDEKTVVLRAAR